MPKVYNSLTKQKKKTPNPTNSVRKVLNFKPTVSQHSASSNTDMLGGKKCFKQFPSSLCLMKIKYITTALHYPLHLCSYLMPILFALYLNVIKF